MRSFAWVLLIAVTTACGSEQSDSGSPGSAEADSTSQAAPTQPASDVPGSLEPASTSRAARTPRARTGLALPTLQLVGEFGCESCTGPELFSRILGVAAGAGNTFAVLDQNAPFVRVWNLETGAVTQFGRAGQGPGELQRPLGLTLVGDSIGVGDFGGRAGRVQFFTSSGVPLGTVSGIQRAGFFPTAQRYVSSPSGKWTLWTDRNASQRSSFLVRTNTTSGESDTVMIPAPFLEGSGATGEDVSTAISDTGDVALGIGEVEYRLTLVATDGKPRVSGGREIERELRSREELAITQARMDSLTRDIVARNGRPAPTLTPIPREIAHFTTGGPWSAALDFDGHGRLWVATTRGRLANTTIFDVFGPDLEYLGEVNLALWARMRHIGATLLVASFGGNLGVQMVRVWRIQEP